ncbi:hypothetical protein BDZ94DRAFT_1040999 [Collybia nuda]|uniref:ZZ-type domain-containing protein n=1 Tax=Collybia nuda TaxID=64659 RepID=A0A9P6CMM7_9AGAR|nr:hypothetical protein BDZ94DRAFT_1040999 [Collybia nuda]
MAYPYPQTQNFNCDSCSQGIAPISPRIHCFVCRDHDLCANCAISGRFTKGHLPSHQVQAFSESGNSNGHQPVLSQILITYRLPPTPAQGPQNDNHNPPPPLPPRSVPTNPPYPHTPGPAPIEQPWQIFVHADMSPTPVCVTLLNDIFTYLDPSNTGYLRPEVYSRFEDDMGCLPHENTWKAGMAGAVGMSQEAAGDKFLKNAFDLFSIEHIIQQRTQLSQGGSNKRASQFQRALGTVFNPMGAQVAQASMPLLTRKGFIDVVMIEVLSDPSKSWGSFSRLLRKYDLPRYRTWGELPRSVLPAEPDPRMLQRVASATGASKQQGETALADAQAVALLSARANQIAVDAIGADDRRYYRYY